jgi:hypothetical protein
MEYTPLKETLRWLQHLVIHAPSVTFCGSQARLWYGISGADPSLDPTLTPTGTF